jgi:hypothetical protein
MKQFTTVEDYLELIAGYRDVVTGLRRPLVYFFSPIINLARYDTSVLDSMSQATIDSKALTERQGELAIKIIVKYKKQLAQKLIDVAPIENAPVFRVVPRKMDYRRLISIKNDKLTAKFPYDTRLIDSIRSFKRDSQGHCDFDIPSKEWQFAMTEYNLSWLHTLATGNQFEIDPEITQLVEKLTDCEKTPFAIELYVDGDKLNIRNCPAGLHEYITEKLGGFGLENLEKLADSAGELGYTIEADLAAALSAQYGKLFLRMAQLKEAKMQQVSQERFDEIIRYALTVNRGPVVIYEPNQSGSLRDLLLACQLETHIQMIDHKYGKKSSQLIDIDSDAKIIYTVHALRNLEHIPLLISTAGMIYGSDKQIMFQRASKVLYLTPEVYRGKPGTNTPTVENLEF